MSNRLSQKTGRRVRALRLAFGSIEFDTDSVLQDGCVVVRHPMIPARTPEAEERQPIAGADPGQRMLVALVDVDTLELRYVVGAYADAIRRQIEKLT